MKHVYPAEPPGCRVETRLLGCGFTKNFGTIEKMLRTKKSPPEAGPHSQDKNKNKNK